MLPRKPIVVALAGAIAAIVLLAVVSLGVVEIAIENADSMTDSVIDDLAQVGRLQLAIERLASASRGYLLTGSRQLNRRVRAIAAGFEISRGRIANVRVDEMVRIVADARAYVDLVGHLEVTHSGDGNATAAGFERELLPVQLALERDLDALARRGQRDFNATRERRHSFLRGVEIAMLGLSLLALAFVTLLSRWVVQVARQRPFDRLQVDSRRSAQAGEEPRYLS